MSLQPPLGVVGEAGLEEFVTVVGTSGIRSCGDGEARPVGCGEYVLACQPYVVCFIPLDNDVAVVIDKAVAAKA